MVSRLWRPTERLAFMYASGTLQGHCRALLLNVPVQKVRPPSLSFFKKRGRRMSNLDARFALSHQENLSKISSRFIDVAALEASDTLSAGPLWLNRLNILRAERGLVALQFQPEESRVITKAFPEYLEALSDPTQSNKVEAMALAMLAGWHAEVQLLAVR